VPRAGRLLPARHPTRPRVQHDHTVEPRMPVDQIVPSLCDPFGAHEQRHPAADASSEADENLGQLFEIAKGQIRYRPRESGETFEISDVTLPDVGDERIFVGPDVEGLDDNAGAFELKRYMSGAGGGFTHPALDRHGAE
jgi:hypothetical protein